MFTRTLKRLVAKIGIAAILFTQMAVAAYACSAMAGQSENALVAMASGEHAARTDGCEQSGAENQNLCQQHCQGINQSVGTTPHLSVPTLAPMPVANVEPVRPAAAPGVVVLPVLLERITAPPLSIRFQVFRI